MGSSGLVVSRLALGCISFGDTATAPPKRSPGAVRKFSRREDIVVATKLFQRMYDGPGGGLSSRAVFEQIDASLRRLDTDHVDLGVEHTGDEVAAMEAPYVPREPTYFQVHRNALSGPR
jgi:1-deoxyxylulose-5-phosphate synthase